MWLNNFPIILSNAQIGPNWWHLELRAEGKGGKAQWQLALMGIFGIRRWVPICIWVETACAVDTVEMAKKKKRCEKKPVEWAKTKRAGGGEKLAKCSQKEANKFSTLVS
jgi:hypothetical protein